MNCLSHQCALAKKPALLSINGLCSALVRFTRSMRSSKFQDLFNQGLDYISNCVNRKVVLEIPDACKQWQSMQSNVCRLMGHILDFNEDYIHRIVGMFNSNWAEDFQSEGEWVHWCAGCCTDRSETVAKSRELLRVLLQRHPDVPLLYRWKGWEPAQDYLGLGLAIHGFLPFLVRKCCTNVAAEKKVLELDEDSADLSFALKQEVRMSKTLAFITSPTILVTWLLAIS